MRRVTLWDVERRREELERRGMKAVALLSEAGSKGGVLKRKTLEDVLVLAGLAVEEARRSYSWQGRGS